MDMHHESEYNRDQWITFRAAADALRSLPSIEVAALRRSIEPYLHFRHTLDDCHRIHLEQACRKACYETGLSACCGFESIITFFADHVISLLCSEPEHIQILSVILQRPNLSGKCVYLTERGCLWTVRPIACAMFLCGRLKKDILQKNPEIESLWAQFLERERDFTWPSKPVLFDDLEKVFIRLAVKSPHMHFHQSPGLIRLKARSGLPV